MNGDDMNDIREEQPPPEMTEQACEALTEELLQVQVKQSDPTASLLSLSMCSGVHCTDDETLLPPAGRNKLIGFRPSWPRRR